MTTSRSVEPESSTPLKILFIAAECAPFYKVGGLADVVGSLPLALKALGHDVRVIMPRYRPINGKQFGLKRVDRFIEVPAGGETRTTEIVESTYHRRAHLLRMGRAFLWARSRVRRAGRSDGVCFPQPRRDRVCARPRAREQLDAGRDPCARLAYGLRQHVSRVAGQRDPILKSIASVVTIHNLLYQGLRVMPCCASRAFPIGHAASRAKPPGSVNWLARGIAHADVVNTVSPTYAAEILTPELGAGLDGLLRQRRGQVSGILNGLDYTEWNPATDARLAATFTGDSLKRRAINKRAVQDQLGLKRKPHTPLISLVTRLVDQKGLDLVIAGADRLFERDVQLAVLGSGDEKYHTALADLKARYPGRVGVEHNFNESLARLIYGGSDLFLMPSHFEPCGLGQLIAMRYGSVPVVRATGGLADTVIDAGRAPQRGTGFAFRPATAAGAARCTRSSVGGLSGPRSLIGHSRRGMAADFSWQVSAQQYVALYRTAVKVHRR